MTEPEPTADDNLTLVQVRLQILDFLMGDGFSYLIKNHGLSFGTAAKEVAAAAHVLENYVLDIVEGSESEDTPSNQ